MKRFFQVYLKGMLLLIPVFFFPLVIDAFGLGKNWIFLATVMLGLVFWMVQMIVKKEDKIQINGAWMWLLGLVIWTAIFWWLKEPGVKIRTLMSTPGLGMLVAMLGWVFLWLQTEEDKKEGAYKWLLISGLVTAVSTLVVFLLPTAKMPISWPKDNPIFYIDQNWSLVGSILGEVWLLAVLVWMSVSKLMGKLKKREGYVGQMVMTAILVLVLFLDIFRMVRSGWGYLDFNSSWTIATESLKHKALTGVGIGNFVEAFNKWKPATFNATKNWTGTFGLSSSGFLQLWTETGLVGLVIGLMIWLSVWKQQKESAQKIKMLVVTAALAITPVNMVSLFLVAWMMAVSGKNREIKLMLKAGESGGNAAPGILAVIMTAAILFGGYWMGRILLGEVFMRNSMVAAAKNNGGDTYNWQVRAIGMNANNAEYRRVYSQTNIALAGALLSKKDLSDDDKQKAATLVQQSVREGKAAVALDTQNASYWNNLAVIYKQLIGNVDGSADWSYQAYSQAVVLDPTNPALKLDFGGLLYAAGGYEEADRLFEQVVSLKPDLANGWYNWAYTAKKMNKIGDAVNRLNQAVALVPTTSGDYDKASQELATWKKEYDELVKQQTDKAAAAKQAETLKVPEALPTPNKKDQVTLPNDGLEPPTSQPVSPTVAPTN